MQETRKNFSELSKYQEKLKCLHFVYPGIQTPYSKLCLCNSSKQRHQKQMAVPRQSFLFLVLSVQSPKMLTFSTDDNFSNSFFDFHPNSDELHFCSIFLCVPPGGAQITAGTVTVPLCLQTLLEKIRFDLHDRVTVEFVSGQEITV